MIFDLAIIKHGVANAKNTNSKIGVSSIQIISFCHLFFLYGKNDGKNLSCELTESEKRVLLELINNPSIPYDTLVVELGISRRTVSRVFVSLVEKRFIERVGTNKKGFWKVIR